MSADLVHTWLLSNGVRLGAWLLVLASPLLAWGLAGAIIGGTRGRERGARVVGQGTSILVVGLLLSRIVELSSASLAGGPLGWLYVLGGASVTWTPGEAALLLALPSAALLGVSALLLAWRRPPPADHAPRIPGAKGARMLLLVAAPLSLLLTQGAWGRTAVSPPLLDVAALLPLACVALAVWTFSAARRDEQAPADAMLPNVATPPPLDVAAAWGTLGAIDSQHLLADLPGQTALATPSAADRAWRLAGAHGRSPQALESLETLLAEAGQGYVVPDLPEATERVFITAALFLSLRVHGLPILVVGSAPEEMRDALRDALHRGEALTGGELIAGPHELSQALESTLSPAVIFLDEETLSERGLAALGRAGKAWARALGIVVLTGVDKGTPLTVTHRAFILRRLTLVLRAAGARWSLLCTGHGGDAGRALVERAFPSHRFHALPLEARSQPRLRVWWAREAYRESRGRGWARDALAPVAASGGRAAVSDPLGVLDRNAVVASRTNDVRLRRGVSFDGIASIAILDAPWLLTAWRCMENRVFTQEATTHESLWSLQASPVARFLTLPGALAQLHRDGRLPVPRPVLGLDNPLILRAHLHAALREAPQDTDALMSLFGRDLVERELTQGLKLRGHDLRRASEGEGLRRVSLLVAEGDPPTSPPRRTLTSRTVRVVDLNGRRPLDEVDELVARTRFYPHRVFALGQERFRVPSSAWQEERVELAVERVDASEPLTRPSLRFEIARHALQEGPTVAQVGALSCELTTFEVRIKEEVVDILRGWKGPEAYTGVSSLYPTTARGIFFPAALESHALYHLARSFDEILAVHLRSDDEDLEVIPAPIGMSAHFPAGSGLLVVERYVRGIGAAQLLEPDLVSSILLWVQAILNRCSCHHGCELCTPYEVMQRGPDKLRVLGFLGGMT